MFILFNLILFTGLGLLLFKLVDRKDKAIVFFSESFFAGVVIAIIVMNLAQFFSITQPQKYSAYLLLFLSVFGWIYYLFKEKSNINLNSIKDFVSFEWYQWFVLIVLLFHFVLIVIHNQALPITPWDAWVSWIAKAKTWFYYGINEPLVSRADWIVSEQKLTSQVFHYPDGLPLLYVMNSVFFGWNENQLAALYPAMFISLLFLFGGYVYKFTENKKITYFSLLLLGTLPFVNMHVLLAGYADIWVAIYLFLVVVLVHEFINNKSNSDRGLGFILFYCLGLVLFKLESWIWLMIILMTMSFCLLGFRNKIYLLASLLLLFILWFAVGGFAFDTSYGIIELSPNALHLPSLGRYRFEFVNTSAALAESLFLSSNWHLLFYLLIVCLGLIYNLPNKNKLMVTGTFLSFATLFIIGLFYFTLASVWANDFTSSNRIVLQIILVIVFFITLVLNQFFKPQKNPD